MRLLVPESFSYGDQPFPWDGLIDPKLFQRVTWLIFPFRPVKIPLEDMSTTIVSSSMISARDTDVMLSSSGFASMLETLSFGVMMTPTGLDVALASLGVGTSMTTRSVPTMMLSSSKGVNVGRGGTGVSLQPTKNVPDP